MDNWDTLALELDAWQAAGLRPTFWWRDDDATRLTPSLRRLIGISNKHKVPLSLSVIPLLVRKSLKRFLVEQPQVSVLQHGFSHRNYSSPGESRSELAGRRSFAQMVVEIDQGRQKLQKLFPGSFLPVMVPPWGRINEELLSHLMQMGFTGLSMGYDTESSSVPGLRRVDVHVDVLKWGNPAGTASSLAARAIGFFGLDYRRPHEFVGLGTALDQIVRHLERRRTGRISNGSPTGIMTHHRSHDEACWEFIDGLLERTGRYSSVKWMTGKDVFC